MIKKILSYAFDKVLPPILVSASLILFTSVAAAALTQTPNDLRANDVSRLRAQLAASDTSLTLEPVKKWVNGVRTTGCFDSPKAFILIEDDLGRREWASYDTKSCDSDYVTTLSGMRRGLTPVNPTFTAGTGLAFDAGAEVRVADYPIIYNNSIYKDRATGLSGSGMIKCVGTSQGCLAVGAFTTAQRDAFTHNSGSTIIHNTTLDAIQFYNGSSWLSLAVSTGSFINATETVAGKVELGTIKDQTGATVLGTSGAPTVVQTQYLTSTGGTHYYYGRIPLLITGGLLSSTIIPASTNVHEFYGNGSDGTVVLTGNITLTRDMHYMNLDLVSYTLNTAGYRVFVRGTLTGTTGKIKGTTGGAGGTGAAGNAGGAGGARGSGGSGVSVPVAATGPKGGTGSTAAGGCVNGAAGLVYSFTNSAYTSTGSTGGKGGTAGGCSAGTSTTAGSSTIYAGTFTAKDLFFSYILSGGSSTFINKGPTSASGGGGGAAAGAGNGGAGGGGGGGNGGNVTVFAYIITGSFTFESIGGAGGNGGNGGAQSAGGGGGGGGGQGGAVFLVYRNKTSWSGSFNLLGGAGGSPGTDDPAGTTAVAGSVGVQGQAVQLQL